MLNVFSHLLFWHWMLFAAVLLILELLTGSGFLFWLGLSAAIVGFSLWLFPDINWTAQLLGFAVLGIVTAVIWRLYLKQHPIGTDRPLLNKRSEQYIGRVFTLDAPIVNGMGKIKVDDSTWRVRGEDLPAGTRVKIVGVDGVILIAEKES
ncbi:MAG TPA: NfeD family protein [Gammaproteobacteria bacterium]|nr:NfeD family protein [Gammaproteobacteria bacterium]